MISVNINFEGGLDVDFKAPTGLKLSVDEGTLLKNAPTLLADKYLSQSSRGNFITDDGSVRPGILVMINEVDSELEEPDAVLKNGDNITFISTLHGG